MLLLLYNFQDGFDAGYLYEYKFLTAEERKALPYDQVDAPLRAISMVENDDTPINYMLKKYELYLLCVISRNQRKLIT